MDAVVKNKTARWVLLFIAVALLAAAAIWGGSLNVNDPLLPIAERINSYGYSIKTGDIFVAGETLDTTIASLLAGVDLTEAREASLEAGFPSDTETSGDIILMLVELEDGDVITIYLRNAEMELCFLQNINTQAIRALGTEAQ